MARQTGEADMKSSTKVMGPRPPIVAWLVRLPDPDAGRDWRLGAVNRVGRDTTENEIVFADEAVSWQHAKIQKEGDQYVLYDSGSLNGTFVNGKKVQKAILYDGDRIRFGDVECVFKRT